MDELSLLIESSKDSFDLTDSTSQESLYQLTESLTNINHVSNDVLLDMAGNAQLPLEFRMAVHLMRSRNFIREVHKQVKLGVVFAMWGEHNRLHPYSTKNPHGEDILRIKIDQLNWITQGSPVDWHLYAVDDGCPYNSGSIAEEILLGHPQASQVQVLHLQEALPVAHGPLKNLPSADQSRKGGAIILGCQQAISDGMEAVIYTDADNSVHLAQIGILLEPYLKDQYRVVLGNRKDHRSVLVKQENRWGIGIKLLRHMQRMVGKEIFSRGILDSQAAFKLYESGLLANIIADPAVFDFSFDSDWIAAVIKEGQPFAKVPFAFVDSFAESASIVQGPMTTWEALLMGLVRSVRHRQLPHNQQMAMVLEEEINSSADLDLLIHHLPPELESASDQELGDPALMSPEQVQQWIKLRKEQR